jgi:hypothetical protein
MDKETKKPPEKKGIPWHTAFFEAIQMELDEYYQDLQFSSEYPLNTQPLKIDVVIIKKSRDITIEKNIASIFRKENIVEYKSPLDYVSIGDFYKAYGYACLYVALNNVDIKDLTLTFVESHYPRELLAHLREVRGYTVEEKMPGIYIIRGDTLPIQIIDNRKLSEEENIWLKDLDNRLEPPEMGRITTEIQKLGKDKAVRIAAYLDVIARANIEALEEMIRMSGCSLALEKVFEEVGWIAKWEARGIAVGEARGEEKGRQKSIYEIALKMKKAGRPLSEIEEFTGLPTDAIEKLN